jgi:hypothetical protein
MLDVLCSTTELEEYGEILAVGDHVDRRATFPRRGNFGTGLDDMEWSFDRYAGLTAGSVERTVAGDIVGLAAIYVRVTLDSSGPVPGWRTRPGSVWLEPVTSTADTRRPLERIEYRRSAPDERGHSAHPSSVTARTMPELPAQLNDHSRTHARQ